MSRYFLFLCLLSTQILSGQSLIRGMVHEKNENGPDPVLFGASVYWLNTELGTVTDKDGIFELERHPDTDTLVVSFIGYVPQMFIVRTTEMIHVTLEVDETNIGAVDVVVEKDATEIKLLLPTNTQIMNQKELRKAACCSLSESFETNPAIDASFTDAVTGTRQIKMLGLDGKYTMITQDNLPSIRGFSVVYGMEMIPGPWIESIHVSKGAGSVVNGFESMTGQINVGMWRPSNAPKFHLNLFASGASRLEANAHYSTHIGEKWSTIFMGHARTQAIAMDRNEDGFIDAPLTSHAIFRNEWEYRNNFMESQFGVNFSYSRTRGGQMDFDFEQEPYQDFWGAEIRYQRLEVFAKTGFFMPNSDYKSIGLQLFYSDAQAETFFGSIPPAGDFFAGNLRTYDGANSSFNANLIYMGEFSDDSPHTFKTGISYSFDDYSDDFWDRKALDPNSPAENYVQDRIEHVPGLFYEYSYQKLERISLIAGLRYDYHNQYGGILSPRAHVRYSFDEDHAIKLSIGRGFRTANVFMENLGLMANSRIWNIRMDDPVQQGPFFNYDLRAEKAWNMGISFTKRFRLDYRDGNISVDAYHTVFEDQVVVDMDDVRMVRIYNLDGRSWSNSIQVEANYELIRRLDMRMAYRYLDVQTDQIDGRLEKVFNAPHRWFVNLAYQTRKKEHRAYWSFDLTYQHVGSQRLPVTLANPVEYQLEERSPSYPLFNAQLTMITKNELEWYLGAENLLNYKQDRPILSAEDPQSEFFDASMIWGPVFGRMIYTGIRWTVE